ncbi:MAG: hypothetical protein ACK40G_06910 [Cytophagaceae bacterium]
MKTTKFFSFMVVSLLSSIGSIAQTWNIPTHNSAGSNYIGTSTGQTTIQSQSSLLFRANGSNMMFIHTNGNVGIGTLTPNTGLHIRKSDSWGTALWLDAAHSGLDGYNWTIQSTGGNHHSGKGNLAFFREGGPRSLTLCPDGNVLIGWNWFAQQKATALLDLQRYEPTLGGKNVMVKLSNNYVGGEGHLNEPAILFDNGTTQTTYGDGWAVGGQVAANGPNNVADGRFRISHYLTSSGATTFRDLFTILHDGRVLIGTSCKPVDINAKLAVNGTIYATSIKVRTTNNGCFPDYVFSPDYKLRSLSEVEEFIKENSHLPEVPSAEEVERSGIDVAEMNEILLKKVEELTLYIIEMRKEIDQLKSNK